MAETKDISFVIPCYRSEQTIGSVVAEINTVMTEVVKKTYEIILVNDSSPDNTFETIRSLADSSDNIIGINLAAKIPESIMLFMTV